jgi:hypothetical protein
MQFSKGFKIVFPLGIALDFRSVGFVQQPWSRVDDAWKKSGVGAGQA